jgi:hypothetical protein
MPDTLSMITADLGAPDASSTSTSTTPLPVSAETTAEINDIPDDDETSIETPEPETQEPETEETPTEPPEDEKPQIENLTDSRWKTVHAGYKYARELGKALGVVGEDGRVDIALFPAIEELTGMQSSYSQQLAMEHDFTSADPQNALQFLENWNTGGSDDPQTRASFAQGMTTLASQMPDYLAQANPHAYQAMAGPVLQRALNWMYQRGAAYPDEKMRNYVLNAARSFEWWLAGGPDAQPGSYRNDQQIQALMQRGDPQQLNQTERQLQEARAQLTQINRQNGDARWQGFYQTAVAEINQQTAADVDKVLAPIKAHYPNELAFNAVRKSYIDQVQQTLNKDFQGRRLYDLAVERAKRTQTEADKQAIVSHWTNMVRRAIQTTRGKFITEASNGIKATSDARHKALAKGAAKTGPTSGGAPKPQSIIPELKRRTGETLPEFNYRRMVADMSA